MHVIKGHPQLLTMVEDVLDVVREADAIVRDPLAGRWQYWRREIGPTRWLCVVVDWAEGPPGIVTAFPSRRIPLR
jgi:hypothetical protein